MDKKVPLLITMDLEIAYDHNMQEQFDILQTLSTIFNELKLPVTIFCTSDAAEKFHKQVQLLHYSGNEIGCHGMTHDFKENFRNMPEEKIRTIVSEATHRIENIIQHKIRCFRGPSMTTSAVTQKILVANGYNADFSVCSQRVDIFNSRGGNLGWLYAPRIPYLPSEKSPYKKGKLPLLIVPLSCMALPFLSGVLFLLGLNFMKVFFRILLREALLLNKPIVYVFHSYEFTRFNVQKIKEAEGRLKQDFHHKFYLRNRETRLQKTIELFKYMLSFNCVEPMKAETFIQRYQLS